MGKINLGRVFLGGIVAGVFSWAGQYIFVLVGLGEKLGLPVLSNPSAARIVTLAVIQILVGGPLAVWFYAAIRPRFGAGPRTAAIAALWIWLVVGPFEQVMVTAIGFVEPLPILPMILMDIAFLPAIIAALLIGAWLYKEEGAPAARVAAG